MSNKLGALLGKQCFRLLLISNRVKWGQKCS
ncbi:hypothetical protein E2C01_030086 [Portunus trituberculatus]|uniref:Uncharacterized protein n=1 Tax=Portunus trituberculatus TaxID=210409 RepID=A0A5B7EQ10_PORTR|nr:hypothetical protein [Portunus trituberculatus]